MVLGTYIEFGRGRIYGTALTNQKPPIKGVSFKETMGLVLVDLNRRKASMIKIFLNTNWRTKEPNDNNFAS